MRITRNAPVAVAVATPLAMTAAHAAVPARSRRAVRSGAGTEAGLAVRPYVDQRPAQVTVNLDQPELRGVLEERLPDGPADTGCWIRKAHPCLELLSAYRHFTPRVAPPRPEFRPLKG
jgi:hypothetical protein